MLQSQQMMTKKRPVDTGPDLKEMASRMKKVRKFYNSYMKGLEKYGIGHDSVKKSIQETNSRNLMELKLAPKLGELILASV